MNFNQAFEKIKDKIEEYDYTPAGDFAIQIELKNKDCEGIFYIQEKDRSLFIEPYRYYDNNAALSVMSGDLSRLLDGKSSLDSAKDANKITITGDGETIRRFLRSLSKKELSPQKSVSARNKKTHT